MNDIVPERPFFELRLQHAQLASMQPRMPLDMDYAPSIEAASETKPSRSCGTLQVERSSQAMPSLEADLQEPAPFFAQFSRTATTLRQWNMDESRHESL